MLAQNFEGLDANIAYYCNDIWRMQRGKTLRLVLLHNLVGIEGLGQSLPPWTSTSSYLGQQDYINTIWNGNQLQLVVRVSYRACRLEREGCTNLDAWTRLGRQDHHSVSNAGMWYTLQVQLYAH